MSYISLLGLYELQYSLLNHGFTITELEKMVPFERDIYTQMVVNRLKEKKEELEKNGHR